MPSKNDPQFKRTKDTLDAAGFRKLFGFKPAPKTETIGVCDGEWRKEGEGWRFYELADLHG